MKRSISIGIIMTLCISLLVGCQTASKSKEEAPEDKKADELQIEEKEETDEKATEDKADTEKVENTEQNNEPQGTKIVTLYASNDNADGFITTETEVSEVTEAWVIDRLIENGVVPGNVQALTCNKTQVDGVDSLELDLNEAFGSFVQSMGTAGEYVTLGSVCNTFLDAYDCEQIKITVEGQMLATGHAEYPGYMTAFE